MFFPDRTAAGINRWCTFLMAIVRTSDEHTRVKNPLSCPIYESEPSIKAQRFLAKKGRKMADNQTMLCYK
jgi:hypothetical protein